MKFSYNWLQDYFEEKLPEAEALSEVLTMHAFEIDSIIKNGNDVILDVKVMPDRAHDCMSYHGLSKEIGALLSRDVKPLIFCTEGDNVVKTADHINLKILDEAKCRRAMKRVAIGVNVAPSPDWLKSRLESVGQRSINNIVDIANFVMLETGQPVHTFDLDKLAGENRKDVFIRPADEGEKLKTLDGKEFILDVSMLVIADSQKALDIAGIKGGADSGITADTQNVLLSACNFDPINIRQTSKKLGLRTDASERFEKELSPELAFLAMDYLSFLVKEIAGGYLAEDILDLYPKKQESKAIEITLDEINSMLGIKIKEKEMEEIFQRLRFEFEKTKDSYKVTPPLERLDINIREDLAEEVGRIYGYEKIKAVLPPDMKEAAHNEDFLRIEGARRQLLEQGYSEVYTYTFVSKGKEELRNPLAEDKKYLRANLTDGLKECINLNIKNLPLLDVDEARPAEGGVKVFEIGTVFGKGGEQINVAYGDKKNITEVALGDYMKDAPKDIEFKQSEKNIKYEPISIYPFILRDIAVWMPEDQMPEKLVKILKDNATDLLAREPKLFDKFNKEGRTSYAFKLVFLSDSKTLSDEEINGIMQNVYKAVEANGWQVR